MKRIKKKLNSNCGASLLFSMLLFLVVCMVSVTILTAALTALKRTHQNRESMQNSLTLESAAKLIRDEMDGSKYIVTTTSKKEDGVTTTDPSTYVLPSNTLSDIVDDAVKAVRNYSLSFEPFEIETNIAGLSDVQVNYVLKEDTTGTGEESESGIKLYKMIFTLLADGSGETIYLTFDVSYSTGTNTRSETVIGENNTGKTIEITTLTETYSWGNPKMSGMTGGVSYE